MKPLYGFLLLAPLLLVACTSESADVADLGGQTLTSTQVTGDGIVSEPAITITFDGDGIAFKGGCNTLFGQGAIEDGVLVMSTPLASTMMACEQALMDRDQWIATLVESQPAASWDGTTLTLESGTDRISFER